VAWACVAFLLVSLELDTVQQIEHQGVLEEILGDVWMFGHHGFEEDGVLGSLNQGVCFRPFQRLVL
jgi:hypothetical protein